MSFSGSRRISRGRRLSPSTLSIRLMEEVAGKDIINYCRISKDDRESLEALDTQADICAYFARDVLRKNISHVIRETASAWRISRRGVHRYVYVHNREENLSGTDFQIELLNILKNERNVVVLVSAADRFTRNVNKLDYYFELAYQNNITIIAAGGTSGEATLMWTPRNLSSNEDFVEAIRNADVESENISRRVRDKRNYIKRLGIQHGFVPYLGGSIRRHQRIGNITINTPNGERTFKTIVSDQPTRNLLDLVPEMYEEQYDEALENVLNINRKRLDMYQRKINHMQGEVEFYQEFGRGTEQRKAEKKLSNLQNGGPILLTDEEIREKVHSSLVRNIRRELGRMYRRGEISKIPTRKQIREILEENDQVVAYRAQQALEEEFENEEALPSLMLGVIRREREIRDANARR